MEKTTKTARPSLAESARIWGKVGLLSFGGPTAQIALMHRLIVAKRRWLSESQFLNALSFCMLLPGPEAMQLATYIGWLLHGVRGGLVAGCLFVLPGFLSIMALSVLYASFQEASFVQAIFFGIKAAVLAIVIEALLRIGKRALKTWPMYLIAAAAFVAIFAFDAPFPLIIAAAALAGFLGGHFDPARFLVIRARETTEDGESEPEAVLHTGGMAKAQPTWRGAVRTALIWGSIWAAPRTCTGPQDWDELAPSYSGRHPSRISRTTDSSRVSPNSTNPASVDQRPGAHVLGRPRRHLKSRRASIEQWVWCEMCCNL